jgi:hypothetical protein
LSQQTLAGTAAAVASGKNRIAESRKLAASVEAMAFFMMTSFRFELKQVLCQRRRQRRAAEAGIFAAGAPLRFGRRATNVVKYRAAA